MPAFRYEAIDPTGRTLKGVIDADSARAGRSQLRTQGLTPLVVELAANVERCASAASRRSAASCRSASRRSSRASSRAC
jgi:general secretion pathway protein F